jgi:putative membrane protein
MRPMLGAILSGFHILAFGIGLGAIFVRGRALRGVQAGDARAVEIVLVADNFWGLAAGLWIVTGLGRAFGGVEKSSDFYLDNGFFWLKMGLFLAVFLLELTPMTTFILWRVARRKGASPDVRRSASLVRVNDVETALVVVIPFVAAAMARGLWLFAR